MKQLNRPAIAAVKTLGTIGDSQLFMHANTPRSQETLARNCALSMAVEFIWENGSSALSASCRHGEINLPKAAVSRRFIAETHRRHCEERSDEAIQSEPGALDCFAEPVIGPAKPDPLARNDAENLFRPTIFLRQNHRVADEGSSSSASTSASSAGRGAAAMAGSIMTAQCSGTFPAWRSSP